MRRFISVSAANDKTGNCACVGVKTHENYTFLNTFLHLLLFFLSLSRERM